ncbi:MAG TPA: hypothetical protein VNX86_11635 [Rhizomicrobium sp.]|jgi:hypothetical protein|nr:hypothetical protein [Rhizomicrobium sp.]
MPEPDGSRPALVVLGMHRSGTSALARALAFCGYALPTDLMAPHSDNPKGFWEPVGVVQLNEKILAALGATWDRPGPFLVPALDPPTSSERVSTAIARKFLPDAVEALRHSYGTSGAIVLKDPRIVLFLPLWRAALAEAGYTPRFILVYRNPLEVAASLRARNRLALRSSLLLWQTYNLPALELETSDALGAVVSYERLLGDPIEALKHLFEQLRIGVEPLNPDASAALREFISPQDCHHISSTEELSQTPFCARQVLDAWDLLENWRARSPGQRNAAIGRLRKRFDEAILFAGSPKVVGRQQQVALGEEFDARPAVVRGRSTRLIVTYDAKNCPLVLHYHLFKNAGTSVDEILVRNFGTLWATEEFPPSGIKSNVVAVEAYLRGRPDLVALSSHTALLPVPDLGGRKVISVVFIRHPIDRLKSAYEFERRQGADTFGSRLAKESDFGGYVRGLLASPKNRQARNFQAHRLAFNEPPGAGSEEERAMRALKTLPFVGLVEAFEKSVQRMSRLLTPYFSQFELATVRKNITRRKTGSIEERQSEIRSEIGVDLYNDVIAANETDLQIFNAVKDDYLGP